MTYKTRIQGTSICNSFSIFNSAISISKFFTEMRGEDALKILTCKFEFCLRTSSQSYSGTMKVEAEAEVGGPLKTPIFTEVKVKMKVEMEVEAFQLRSLEVPARGLQESRGTSQELWKAHFFMIY